MGELIDILILTFIVVFIIFLILRELMCWYWKINKMISILENIQNTLSLLVSSQGITPPTIMSVPKKEASEELSNIKLKPELRKETINYCPYCNAKLEKKSNFCPFCGKPL